MGKGSVRAAIATLILSCILITTVLVTIFDMKLDVALGIAATLGAALAAIIYNVTPGAPEPEPGRLLAIAGPAKGKHFTIRAFGQTVGRSDTKSDHVIDDHAMSNPHALIRKVDDHWYIRDMNSKNGTEINGRKIDRETRLHPDSTVRMGMSLFQMLGLRDDGSSGG